MEINLIQFGSQNKKQKPKQTNKQIMSVVMCFNSKKNISLNFFRQR